MRFANHAEKCQSGEEMYNCKATITYNGKENTIYLEAIRNINAGEELFFDYHFDIKFDWLKEYRNKFLIGQ